jgi:hypothetical protein
MGSKCHIVSFVIFFFLAVAAIVLIIVDVYDNNVVWINISCTGGPTSDFMLNQRSLTTGGIKTTLAYDPNNVLGINCINAAATAKDLSLAAIVSTGVGAMVLLMQMLISGCSEPYDETTSSKVVRFGGLFLVFGGMSLCAASGTFYSFSNCILQYSGQKTCTTSYAK